MKKTQCLFCDGNKLKRTLRRVREAKQAKIDSRCRDGGLGTLGRDCTPFRGRTLSHFWRAQWPSPLTFSFETTERWLFLKQTTKTCLSSVSRRPFLAHVLGKFRKPGGKPYRSPVKQAPVHNPAHNQTFASQASLCHSKSHLFQALQLASNKRPPKRFARMCSPGGTHAGCMLIAFDRLFSRPIRGPCAVAVCEGFPRCG